MSTIVVYSRYWMPPSRQLQPMFKQFVRECNHLGRGGGGDLSLLTPLLLLIAKLGCRPIFCHIMLIIVR